MTENTIVPFPTSPYCRVRARVASIWADGPDDDANPDWRPAVGEKVALKPSITDQLLTYDVVGADPIIVTVERVDCFVGEDGFLTKYDGRPVYIAPTDDPLLSVTGWTWTATIKGRSIPFSAPTGGVVNLADFITAPATDNTKSWIERIPELVDAAENVIAGLAAAVGELDATLDERLATFDLDGYLPDPVELGTVDWANEIPEIVGYWSWTNNKSEGTDWYGQAKETAYSATPHPDQPIWEIVDIDAEGWFLHTAPANMPADQFPIYAVEGLTGRTLDDLTGLKTKLKIAPPPQQGFWFGVDPVFRTPDGKYFAVYMSEIGNDWTDYQSVYEPSMPGESMMIGLAFRVGSGLGPDHQTRIAIDGWAITRPSAFGNSVVTGVDAIAVGHGNTVSGKNSTAVGTGNTVSGNFATAVGYNSVASKSNATAIGDHAQATGSASVAMGRYAKASGATAFATGDETEAAGNWSAAFGSKTRARRNSEHASGSLRVTQSMTPVGRDGYFDDGTATKTLTYRLYPGVSRVRATITAINPGGNAADTVAVWELDAMVNVSADGSSVRWLGDAPSTDVAYADAGATGRTIAYTLVTGASPALRINGAGGNGGASATKWAAHFTNTEFAQ